MMLRVSFSATGNGGDTSGTVVDWKQDKEGSDYALVVCDTTKRIRCIYIEHMHAQGWRAEVPLMG